MLERLFLRLGIAIVVLAPLLLGVKWERASRPDKDLWQQTFIMSYQLGKGVNERAGIYNKMMVEFQKKGKLCESKQN